MQINKFLTTLFIILCYVYNVVSSTSFIKDGIRAEFFELTDNVVPIFKINIPDNEFKLLKKTASLSRFGSLNSVQINYIFSTTVKKIVEMLNEVNFHSTFMNENINEIIPLLNINENGFPTLDVDSILAGYDFTQDQDNFNPYENYDNSIKEFLQTNKDFNLNEVLQSVANLTIIDGAEMNPNLKNILSIYKPVEEKKNKPHTPPEYGYYGEDGEYTYYDYPTNYEYDDYYYEEDNSRKTVFHYVLLMNNEEKTILQYPSFKTKEGSMTVNINGEQKNFKKITFSLSGKNSRYYPKPNYNIKIRGKDDLYGRSQFKLRSDSIEPSFLRSKLIADIHNHLELPSISANYIQLYINEEYMGLYIITDIYKKSWVEAVYGDAEPTTLFKCDDSFLNERTASGCKNENEDIIDQREWNEFLKALDKAQSANDFEELLDVDQFLNEMALEYLLRSQDHLQNGQNYYMYKPKNGKWMYLTHDFDLDFGQDNFSDINTPFNEFFRPMAHIIDILILKDSSRFEMKLQEIVMKVFNPDILYPRIDELKQFIRPYVVLDKNTDTDGRYPGAINTKSEYGIYSLKQWEDNTEFETIKGLRDSYGLKYWILSQYRNVCKTYNLPCNPLYMDENFDYHNSYSNNTTPPPTGTTSTNAIENFTNTVTTTTTTTTTITITTTIAMTSFPSTV